MIVTTEDQLQGLKACGKAVRLAIETMGQALEPGMTARELDEIGRKVLEQEGAESAPELVYDFPGATCISIEPVIAHGWADEQTMKPGDMINIDVSASKDGYFADAGATFILPPVLPAKEAIVKAAKRARDKAIAGLARACRSSRRLLKRRQWHLATVSSKICWVATALAKPCMINLKFSLSRIDLIAEPSSKAWYWQLNHSFPPALIMPKKASGNGSSSLPVT